MIQRMERTSQKCLALAGMNSDFLTDGGTDFRFDAFKKAHANPAEFIGWPDRGGNFQCSFFTLLRQRCGVVLMFLSVAVI